MQDSQLPWFTQDRRFLEYMNLSTRPESPRQAKAS